MTPESALIQLRHISKSFGPVKANDDISLDITPGRILALLGENGAGKSTLMSILAGRFLPDSGSISIHTIRHEFHTPGQAIEAGIGMVYQHFMLAGALTVTENVILGQEGGFFLKPGQAVSKVRDLSLRYGLAVDPLARVDTLSMGEKQRVEILKLLYRSSSALILDEPTTVLTPTEIEQLFAAMRQMADQGKAIVFISHKLNEVMAVADHVAILRQGRIVDSMDIKEVSSKRELARRMVGRDVFLTPGREQVPQGDKVLDIQDLCLNTLEHVSLSVHTGEVLAIVGVAGNGQKPLVEAVCGLAAPESGRIELFGQAWNEFYSSPAARGKLCYIPEDRLGLATCPNLDLEDNFLLTTRNGFTKGPWLRKAEARIQAAATFSSFNVQPNRLEAKAGQLSGGNLQKLVLARELFRQPSLIVAEQPSQGLDISATEEIWANLLQARNKAGVLLITGDLNEALTLADRIAVIFRGRIMDCFPSSDQDKVNAIGPLMAGIENHEAHCQD